MKYKIILFIIIFIIIIFSISYQKNYPNTLNEYIIYGKLDKKDKKNFHYQFKKNKYYKINKYGNVLETGNYHYKRKKDIIFLNINNQKYLIKIRQIYSTDIFKCQIENRNILLLKIKKKIYLDSLEGKIIKFTNLITDYKNRHLKHQEIINYYSVNYYLQLDPFLNNYQSYNYYKNNYGKAYITTNNEIIKLLYDTPLKGTFILKSGKKIIEGKFIILN